MLSTKGMTGHLFAGHCQQHFQTKICLRFLAMVRLPDPKPTPAAEKRKLAGATVHGDNRTRRPQWHSSHVVLRDEMLDNFCLIDLHEIVLLNMRPSSACEYRDDIKGRKILSDVYYMLRNSNQSAFNSFIVHRGHLYIFQSIGDKQHDIREGLLPFLATCTGLPPHYNLRFVLVLPDDVGLLKCPVPQNTEFQQLGIFLSVIAVEDEKPGFSDLITLAARCIREWWYQ